MIPLKKRQILPTQKGREKFPFNTEKCSTLMKFMLFKFLRYSVFLYQILFENYLSSCSVGRKQFGWTTVKFYYTQKQILKSYFSNCITYRCLINTTGMNSSVLLLPLVVAAFLLLPNEASHIGIHRKCDYETECDNYFVVKCRNVRRWGRRCRVNCFFTKDDQNLTVRSCGRRCKTTSRRVKICYPVRKCWITRHCVYERGKYCKTTAFRSRPVDSIFSATNL